MTVIAYPDAKGVCESFGGTYASETGIVSGGSGKPAQWSCTYQSVDDAFGALVNRCVLDAAHTGTFAVAYVMVSGDHSVSEGRLRISTDLVSRHGRTRH